MINQEVWVQVQVRSWARVQVWVLVQRVLLLVRMSMLVTCCHCDWCTTLLDAVRIIMKVALYRMVAIIETEEAVTGVDLDHVMSHTIWVSFTNQAV